MEVKKAGKYKTKGGKTVEIYGFADDSGPVKAEGFFEDTRHMGQWNPETGVFEWGREPNPENDIVSAVQ